MLGFSPHGRALLLCLLIGVCLRNGASADMTAQGGNVSIINVTATTTANDGVTIAPTTLLFGTANDLVDCDLGTFVRWSGADDPNFPIVTANSTTITFTLNGAYDITQFLLWNDFGGDPNNGAAIVEYAYDLNGTLTIEVFNTFFGPGPGNNTTPEQFSLPTTATNVNSIQLTFKFSNALEAFDPIIEIREIGFVGTPVPEPSPFLIFGSLSIACAAYRFRVRRKQARASSSVVSIP